MPTYADLTDDIAALKVMVLERESALANHAPEIEHLKLLIAKLKRIQFGRKSEKLDHEIVQLELRLEELQADEAALHIGQPPWQTCRPCAKRAPLPPHLPRDDQFHLPADAAACSECGGAMKRLGEDVSEQLEYVPARFRVIRHVRPKYACSCCDHIAQPPAPTRPIARGLAGPGLLSHILVAKYCDHLPLYRQSVMYVREGVTLEQSTMAKWVGATSALFALLVDAICSHVMAASKLHADDTPAPVLAPGRGQTKTGRLWVYGRDDRPAAGTAAPTVWSAYTENRKGNIRSGTWHATPAYCRPMPMEVTRQSTAPDRSSRRLAGRTHGANSMNCIRHGRQPSRPRRCAGLGSCTQLRPGFGANHPASDGACGKPKRGRCSMQCKHGCARPWKHRRVNRIRQQRFCMRSTAGRRWYAMPTTAPLRLTTRQLGGHCAV